MHKIAADTSALEENGDEESEFKPLTAEQAARWRSSQVKLSVWRVVMVQWIAAVVMTAVIYFGFRQAVWAWSVLYGGLAAGLPSAVMAYGLTSSRLARMLSGFAQTALAGFFLWEAVKVLLTMVLLGLAPLLMREISWPALVVGLVVVLKVHWLAFLMQSVAKK